MGDNSKDKGGNDNATAQEIVDGLNFALTVKRATDKAAAADPDR